MKTILYIFFLGLPLLIYGQVPLENISGNITRYGSMYWISGNSDIVVNQAITPIKDATLIIRNGARLRFGPSADITFGEVERDGSNAIIYGTDGKPVIKSRVLIIEEADSQSCGVDNYNNSGNVRFRTGCQVNFEGTTWISKTTPRSDFDIQTGANVHFFNSEIVLDGANNTFVHFASSDVEIDGLTIDNRKGAVSLEFAHNGIPTVLNSLKLIDNNPGSGTRHFVFINNTDTRYELNNFEARNIGIYEGSGFIAQLNNPLNNIPKSTNNSSGVLEVHRDLNINAVLQNGNPAAGVRLYIERTIGTSFQQTTNLDAAGTHKERLLQYLVPHGSFTKNDMNQYNIGLASYNHQIYTNNYTIDFVPNVKGENYLSNVLLIDDPNLTETNEITASAISGIAVVHNPADNSGTITINQNVDLCQLYDFIKWEKVNNSLSEPSLGSLATTVNGGTLNIGDYQLIITGTATLSACDKFNSIISNVAANLTNATDNLAIALTDINGTYKLIRLSNLNNNNLIITDNIASSEIVNTTNISGIYSTVTQSNSTSVSIKVTRAGYSNWAVDLDLSNGDNVFNYTVVQSALAGNAATLANQSKMVFLLQKMIQQTASVKSSIAKQALTNINLTTTNITGSEAAAEKQEEIILLSQRLLLNTTVIKSQLK